MVLNEKYVTQIKPVVKIKSLLVSSRCERQNVYANRSYFFDQGIRFECVRCGACCTGEPGIVRATAEEVNAMADVLEMDVDAFRRKYLYRLGDDWGVKEEEDGRCMLFGPDGCTVYSARPLQCKTFPFWPENLRSRYRWRQIRAECPGIGRGRLFDKETILELIAMSMSDNEGI